VCPRFSALSADEVSDLWLLAQQVAAFVEHDFKADSMSLVIQDGPAAGQSIPHVHIHVLPRRFFDTGDLEHNDEVYDMINAASKREAAARCAAVGCWNAHRSLPRRKGLCAAGRTWTRRQWSKPGRRWPPRRCG